jgi:hypothetical protein
MQSASSVLLDEEPGKEATRPPRILSIYSNCLSIYRIFSGLDNTHARVAILADRRGGYVRFTAGGAICGWVR